MTSSGLHNITVTIQTDWHATALATAAQTAPSQPTQQRLGPLSPETSKHWPSGSQQCRLGSGAQALGPFLISQGSQSSSQKPVCHATAAHSPAGGRCRLQEEGKQKTACGTWHGTSRQDPSRQICKKHILHTPILCFAHQSATLVLC